jgi:Protein of unknown function (DUF1553)/Protein of unknown function (DUF1549)/Planctomycete cytochrome C
MKRSLLPGSRLLPYGLLLTALAALTVGPHGGSHKAPHDESRGEPAPDFNNDVLPILADHCFSCHGADARTRKGGLRLDTEEGATAASRHGRAVMPGDTAASLLLVRVEDSENPMPPEPRPRLTGREREVLRQWVGGGARWEEHWAFVPPRQARLPAVRDGAWPRNPIDYFILARIEREGLTPSPEADRATLLRRLSLDLTGLPPSPEEVSSFLADARTDAYQCQVDRLLDSPRFGEHMARYWLDLARYADTHGMHLDNYREIWPYREWVIRAFNTNLPFDRFLTEQVAGDLLPQATVEQQVATGFLRCHPSTDESNSVPEDEARFATVVDMAETTATVALGLTLGCARCHDHKYDPLSTRDYYRFAAYFNSNEGPPFDYGGAYAFPAVAVPTAAQVADDARLRRRIDDLRGRLGELAAGIPADVGTGPPCESAETEPREFVWLDDEPEHAEYLRFQAPVEDCRFVRGPEHPVKSGAQSLLQQTDSASQFWIDKLEPSLVIGAGDVLVAHVWLDPRRKPRELVLEWNANGWAHRAFWGEDLAIQGKLGTPTRWPAGPLPEAGRWARIEVPAERLGLPAGTEVTGVGFRVDEGRAYWDRVGSISRLPLGRREFATFRDWEAAQGTLVGRRLPPELAALLLREPARRSADEQRRLREHYLIHGCPETRSVFAGTLAELRQAEREMEDLHSELARSPVFKECTPPRPAHVHERGQFDRLREPVERGTPSFLPPSPRNAPPNRLGLAQWLTSPAQPLTARAAVNRFWQQVFGTGIVSTPDDLGRRGALPSDPELLDWLAVDFRVGGWNIKHLMRLMATSAAYRQSSRAGPELLARDPANRLMARAPRYRLDAETLRDQALACGGLLVNRLGGPSVKPPQPPGLWEPVANSSSNTARFVADTGPDRIYRRSVYTFLKRTVGPPQMSLLDAPSREVCVCRRERTDTPSQALLLLNEEQFFEAARGLACLAIRDAENAEARLASLFLRATARPPGATELARLRTTWEELRGHFHENPDLARQAAGGAAPGGIPLDEMAAYALTANLLLNLDEVLNRE